MNCYKNMNTLFLVIAVLAGVLVSIPAAQKYFDVMVIIRFFQAMLPIMAVGALMKYLFKE